MYYIFLTVLVVFVPMFFLIRYFNKKYEREKYLYTEEERKWMEEEIIKNANEFVGTAIEEAQGHFDTSWRAFD
jgi:hypothetical protein